MQRVPAQRRLSSPGERDAVTGGQQSHDLGHGPNIGAAQHGVRGGDGADLRGDRLCACQPDGCVSEREPPVGLFSEEGSEAEGTGQREVRGVEACHDVPGSAPAIDRLSGVADHDQLSVGALSSKHVFQDRVGVLCFVEEEKIGVDPWLSQGPHLQVMIMLETDESLIGIL